MDQQDIVLKDARDAQPVAKWQNTSKGKGRVQPRVAKGFERPSVLRLTGISAEDEAQGAKEGDPAPRYPEGSCAGWLPAFSMAAMAESYKALACMRGSQAVLLRDTPLVSSLTSHWTLATVAEAIGTKHKDFKILCSDAVRNRFIEGDQSKNTFGSHYHVRECQTQTLRMAFSEFAQCTQTWTSRLLYFKDEVMTRVPSLPDRGGASKLAASEHVGTQMKAELTGWIDWQWLEAIRRAQRLGPLHSVGLEVGSINGLLPASYECHDRLIAQVWGRRRVLLMNPSQAFNGLAPYPVHHVYDRYAMLDLEAPDLAMWPEFAKVQGHVVILRPGDVLFVPRYWFVHVQQLESSCGCLVFNMQQGPRARAREAIPLQLSRLLEERMAVAEGVRNVHHWLSLIARGEEVAWIDLDTVQGYRRMVFCEAIIDELKLNLCSSDNDSDARAREILEGICRNRLALTTCLNKDYREPLYLKDKAVYLPDTRSQEERKYPEFFRNKLRDEGWNVPDSISTVPIPGYNVPENYGRK